MDPPSSSEPDAPVSEPIRPDRTARREQAAADVLRAFIRDLVVGACAADELPAEPLRLALELEVDPVSQFALAFAPSSLREQVLAQVEEATARHGAYVPGHAYCYRCYSSLCEHSRPPEPTMVFDAYGATGVPLWKEFGQALLDLRDERVHQLYARPPTVVARVVNGKSLKTAQLRSFGRSSKTYSLLGQVVAGYFLLPEGDASPLALPGRVAMTFQFVETRRARGAPALHVNLICPLPNDAALSDCFAGGWAGWVQRAYRNATRSLAGMERTLNEAGPGADPGLVLRRIPQVMTQLAASLDRGFRQSERRTPHAEQRRRARPIHRAMDETREAGDDDVLRDEKTGRIVVRGDHGRFHVFTAEGKHLTSFKGGPDTVDFRVRTHRWSHLSGDEREAWQAIWRSAGNQASGESSVSVREDER